MKMRKLLKRTGRLVREISGADCNEYDRVSNPVPSSARPQTRVASQIR